MPHSCAASQVTVTVTCRFKVLSLIRRPGSQLEARVLLVGSSLRLRSCSCALKYEKQQLPLSFSKLRLPLPASPAASHPENIERTPVKDTATRQHTRGLIAKMEPHSPRHWLILGISTGGARLARIEG